MPSFLILANAAAPVAKAANAGLSAITTPLWVLAIGATLGLLIVAIVLGSIATKLTKAKGGDGKAEFAKMLCERIWTHTDTALGPFTRGLTNHPSSLASLQIQVRGLREDLSEAVLYTDYMKAYGAAAWPSPRLFGAYSAWAGQIASMEQQLADLYAQISRPIAQEPIDKERETRLIRFFENEQRVLNRGVDKLHGHAFRLCEAAREHLKKKPGGGHGFGKHSDDDDDDHASCPCCRRAPDKHVQPRLTDLPINVVPIEAKAEDKHHDHAPAAPQLVSASPVFSLQPIDNKGDEKKHGH